MRHGEVHEPEVGAKDQAFLDERVAVHGGARAAAKTLDNLAGAVRAIADGCHCGHVASLGGLRLDLGLQPDASSSGGPLPVTSSRMGHLWDALARGYTVLGLEQAAGGDQVFRDLVLARIIEPASKLDSARVLDEADAVDQ